MGCGLLDDGWDLLDAGVAGAEFAVAAGPRLAAAALVPAAEDAGGGEDPLISSRCQPMLFSEVLEEFIWRNGMPGCWLRTQVMISMIDRICADVQEPLEPPWVSRVTDRELPSALAQDMWSLSRYCSLVPSVVTWKCEDA